MRNTFSKEMILAVGFLAILVAPGIIQTALELRGGDSPQVLNLFHQKATAKNLRAYEREMEEVSWVAKHLRPAVQYVQFRLLREAGDKAIVGRDGWMFYKPGFRYLTERPDLANRAAPSSDPLPAIVAFRDELAKRQIQLLVMIAPNKESVYPERLTRRAVGFDVLVCPQTRRLLEELKRVEIEVVDLFETYRRAKHRPPQNPASPLYLVQDSHWSPAGRRGRRQSRGAENHEPKLDAARWRRLRIKADVRAPRGRRDSHVAGPADSTAHRTGGDPLSANRPV